MVHIEDVLVQAIAQRGDRYVFGSETSPLDPDPTTFDCSELVQWSCLRAGIDPTVPDGAYFQWRDTTERGIVLPVEEGLRARGALLFSGSGQGVGREAITHVAWSLGDGTTIEARGSRWGVGTWAATGRFRFAGLLAGVDYGPRPPAWPHEFVEDEMRQFTAPILWQPPGADGRDPYLIVSEVPGNPREFTVASVNHAPFDGPMWSLDQRHPRGWWVDEWFPEPGGLWVRRYLNATGRPQGVLVFPDRVAVACDAGGTYTVSRQA
ncbi:MAG: NlpC/P60 family protein [Acidimicrobiia bacterium]